MRRFLVALVLLYPVLAGAQAHRTGRGIQMTCASTPPTASEDSSGLLWCKSTDSNKLYYTTPAGSSAAVGSGGGGGGSSFYQIVQSNGSDQTQRGNLNFSTLFTLSDSSGSDRTTVTLATSGVTAATYGDATHVGACAVSATGQITSCSAVAITGLAESAITSLVSDLAAKASTSTTISAGIGLSGGGSLASNRTITLDLTNANTWTASQNVASVALSDGATISTNSALGNTFTVTIAGNRTLANPTNLVSGGTYQWEIVQDGTGSRTLAYGTKFKWPGGVAPVLQADANAKDLISCLYDGTDLLCGSLSGSGAGGGTGTVTSVAAGTGMSFSTITSSGTVAIDTAVVCRYGVQGTFTADQGSSTFALSDGANISTTWSGTSKGNTATVTLAGNRTLDNPTGMLDGHTYQWFVKQDGTGSRTLAYGSKFAWSAGTAPTLTTTANKTDMISCTYISSPDKFYCVLQGNF